MKHVNTRQVGWIGFALLLVAVLGWAYFSGIGRPDAGDCGLVASKALQSSDMKNVFETGQMLDGKKCEQEALALYSWAADAKMPDAMAYLGAFYVEGKKGLAKDAAKGWQYIEDAANLGSTVALMMVAELYETRHEQEKAWDYYSMAAEGGNHAAMLRLSKAYRLGELGREASSTQADVWEKRTNTY